MFEYKRKDCFSYMFIVTIASLVIFMFSSSYRITLHGLTPKFLNASGHYQIRGLTLSTDTQNVYSSTQLPENSNARKWVLVDTKMHFNNSLNVSRYRPTGQHTILWFNSPPWFRKWSYDFVSLCDYNNCHVTFDKALIRNASAVMYCAICSRMGNAPPLGANERDPDQIWISYGLESPFNHHFPDYASPHWRYTFNWSMTYRTDSDVQQPYGVLERRVTPIEKDYSQIFDDKPKFAVWIVSHCSTHSKREVYVQEMQKYVTVDIYGMCGRQFSIDVATLVKEYKFFLSFENSLCPDYVTEKVFKYFEYDIIQVVRGGVDYDKLLPNDTFINTAKFPGAKALAQYLIDVGSSRERYVEYLRRKATYKSYRGDFTYRNSMCDICRKLNHKESYRKSYPDMHEFIQKTRTCIQPSEVSDIHVR